MISFIVEEAGETRRLELDAVPVHLGRAEDAEVSVINGRASRHHARIERGDGGFVIIDLDSSNGTCVNGKRVGRASLSRGDSIEVGDAKVTFLGGDVSAPQIKLQLPEVPGFTVLDELGEGVLTQVLLARQDALGRKVAIKFLDSRWLGSKAIVSRFNRQVRQQSRLHHHGLASGIDVGEVDGVPYFVAEYLEGDTVGARVRSSMAFEVPEGLRVLKLLLETVEWVHGQGHVVGSLHAEAVILGDTSEVWLTSLGFPLPSPRSFPDSHGQELLYLAPECVSEPENGGARGDVFSVGALAAFIFTGRPPRSSEPTAGQALASASKGPAADLFEGRRLPSALCSWMQRLMSEAPKDRPADGGAALRELEAVEDQILKGAESLQSSARAAAGRAVDGSVPVRRQKWFVLMNLGITAAILLGLNYWLFSSDWVSGWFSSSEPEAPAEVERRAASTPEPQPLDSSEEAEPVDPEPEESPEDLDAARAFEEVSAAVERMIGEDKWPDAEVAATKFAQRFAGSERWGAEGVGLVATIKQRHSQRSLALLKEVEDHLASSRLDDARRSMARFSAVAGDAQQASLEVLKRRLRSAEAAAKSAQGQSGAKPDGSQDKPEPATSKTGEPGSDPEEMEALPRDRWPRLVERALSSPGAHKLRSRLLRLADGAEDLGGLETRFRWLRAIDSSLRDLEGAWAAQIGKKAAVQLQQKAQGPGQDAPARTGVEGVLKSVEKDRLVLVVEGEEVEVPLDRVAPEEMLRMLSVLPPTLDRYLARGRLNLAMRAGEEAWFDFQAALLLVGEDPVARELAETELKRLRRSPPRGRRR